MKSIKVYFAAKSVLRTQRQCRKDFGRNNVPDGRTIQCLVAKFQKTGSVADAHESRHHSLFSITPENIQNLRERHEESHRKSTCSLSQETGISRTSVLRMLNDDLKLFPYKIQILHRQTDQNEVERETLCEDISQRIENDSGLLDLNDLNNVDNCGLCGASATLPVSEIWPSYVEQPFYQVHCSCQKQGAFFGPSCSGLLNTSLFYVDQQQLINSYFQETKISALNIK